MRWVTNTSKHNAADTITHLCQGWDGRDLVTGAPRGTESEPAARLEAMGLVGIYERAAGRPLRAST